jgi:N6-adenosine-specific RNA methylase IME4
MSLSPPPSNGSPRSSILYQNEAKDITLLDIPASIAVAQGNPDAFLRSTAPLKEPFEITHEPKSEKAKQKLASCSSTPLYDEYKTVIKTALSQISGNVSALPWCLPRKLMIEAPKRRKTDMEIDDPERDLDARLREWSASKGVEEEPFDFEKMMASISTPSDPNATLYQGVPHPWLMSYKPVHEEGEERQEPWNSSFYNSNDHALHLTIFENTNQTAGAAGEARRYSFRIPPRASLFLSDSTHSDAFRASFRELTEEYVLPRHFDFILMDPPWPSGSAKRKGNYEQVGGMPYMMKILGSMDIENYFEHNALVGIWITNKQSLRDYVLGPGGLFEQWNVGLIEEWIWIKTTTKGEPMLSLDSEWRKPYEVLLLGRAAPNSWTTMEHAPSIKRRVIAAVPDVHSRKPCLKELIEPLMPDEKYNALEIFSRYLVAGWTSWGNEVLKFNWDHYWASGANGALTPLESLDT